MSLAHVKGIKVPPLSQIVPILAVLMEVFWGYAWLVWISGWASLGAETPPLTIISCMMLPVAIEILTRLSLAKNWSIKKVRLIVVSSSLILLFALTRWNLGGGYSFWDTGWFGYAATNIPLIAVASVFGIYLIWRGISAGRDSYIFEDLQGKFVIGMVAIIALIVIWRIAGGGNTIWSTVGIYVLSFIGLGLLTLAMANLEAVRAELMKHKEDISAFNRRWVSLMVTLVVAILGISAVLSSIFSTNLVGAILRGLSVLGNWLLIAFSYIFIPIGYLVAGLIFIGKLLISWLGRREEAPQFNLPDFSDLYNMAQGQQPAHLPAGLILALKWGGLVFLISLVIFILARSLIRYSKWETDEEVEEVHETLWSFSSFKLDLHDFLSWLFRWARRKKKTTPRIAVPPIAVTDGENDSSKIYNVREIYQALLWRGRQIGIPRQASETPYEYGNKLETYLESSKDEIDALTEAYISERYGEVNPEQQKLELLNRLWRSLRSKLKNSSSDEYWAN